MGIKRNVAVVLSTGLTALVLAACSESPISPVVPSGFAVGDTPTPTPVAELGKGVICKTGNAGGSFDVTRVAVGASNGTVSGLDSNIPAGTCLEVANDFSPDEVGSIVTVDEDPAANTVQTVVSCSQAGANVPPSACAFTDGGSLFVNSFHGYVIVYNNAFTPPPPPPPASCTYTKGWYRNNGEDDVTAVDGRTADEARAIFDATPGKPGDVTFGGNNSLLNLYQQFLAALLNGGASGPQAVQDALGVVGGGTGGTGLAITTTLTKAQISAATGTLSSFNEGSFAGFPHCDDEVVSAD